MSKAHWHQYDTKTEEITINTVELDDRDFIFPKCENGMHYFAIGSNECACELMKLSSIRFKHELSRK